MLHIETKGNRGTSNIITSGIGVVRVMSGDIEIARLTLTERNEKVTCTLGIVGLLKHETHTIDVLTQKVVDTRYRYKSTS